MKLVGASAVGARMTPAGRTLFDEMVADHARWVDEALSDVGPGEKEQLTALLVRVRRAFESAQTDDETREDAE